MSITSVELALTNSFVSKTQQTQLTIGGLQIDNQLESQFPVVLNRRAHKHQSGPFMSVTAVRSVDYDAIHVIPTFHLNLVPVDVNLDGILLTDILLLRSRILTNLSNETTGQEGHLASEWSSGSDRFHEAAPIPRALNDVALESQKLYFEDLHIQSIDVLVSFVLAAASPSIPVVASRLGDHPGSNPLFLVSSDAMFAALGSIDRAPVQLRALQVRHSYVTLDVLQSRVLAHYRSQVDRQTLVLLGSNALFNTTGLLKQLGAGVKDFFYEPMLGSFTLKKFTAGVAKGTVSLVSKSLFGVLDSCTRFSGAISRGLNATTDRVDRFAGVTPVAGVWGNLHQWLTGVAVLPWNGFQADGANGLWKGLAAGTCGLVIKPFAGLFSVVAVTSAAFRQPFDNEVKIHLARRRPPRQFNGPNAPLQAYSFVPESLGKVEPTLFWKGAPNKTNRANASSDSPR